jgi:hypothetical protein
VRVDSRRRRGGGARGRASRPSSPAEVKSGRKFTSLDKYMYLYNADMFARCNARRTRNRSENVYSLRLYLYVMRNRLRGPSSQRAKGTQWPEA